MNPVANILCSPPFFKGDSEVKFSTAEWGPRGASSKLSCLTTPCKDLFTMNQALWWVLRIPTHRGLSLYFTSILGTCDCLSNQSLWWNVSTLSALMLFMRDNVLTDKSFSKPLLISWRQWGWGSWKVWILIQVLDTCYQIPLRKGITIYTSISFSSFWEWPFHPTLANTEYSLSLFLISCIW